MTTTALDLEEARHQAAINVIGTGYERHRRVVNRPVNNRDFIASGDGPFAHNPQVSARAAGGGKAYGVTGASYDRSTRQFRRNARWLTQAFAHLVRKRLAGTTPVSERRCKSAGRYPARAQRGGVTKLISKRSAVPLGVALLLCLL